MERKFKSHMVDVRGLSRKEAKEKRKERIVNLCCIVILKKRIMPIQERINASVKFIHHEHTSRKI